MPRPVLLLVIAACLLVAACGGASVAPSVAGTVAPAASSAPGATTPAATGSPATSLVPSAAGSFDGTALCGFLQSELPALVRAGSAGGAVSVLAIDYANWIEADASRVLPDAAAMDAVTEASCPAVRTEVLKTLGGNSFDVAF